MKMMSKGLLSAGLIVLALSVSHAGCAGMATPPQRAPKGFWVAGDFHAHTWLTDGKHTEREVVQNAFEKFGLDWMANSEHGGNGANDPAGKPWDFTAVKLLGDPVKDKDGNVLPLMWRWQSLQAPYSWLILYVIDIPPHPTRWPSGTVR